MSFKVITLDELNKEEFQPNWVVPPGQTLQELIDMHWSKDYDYAALMLGVSRDYLTQLFEGEVPMTALMAMKLQSFFGVSTSFWYTSECIYQLRKNYVKDSQE